MSDPPSVLHERKPELRWCSRWRASRPNLSWALDLPCFFQDIPDQRLREEPSFPLGLKSSGSHLSGAVCRIILTSPERTSTLDASGEHLRVPVVGFLHGVRSCPEHSCLCTFFASFLLVISVFPSKSSSTHFPRKSSPTLTNSHLPTHHSDSGLSCALSSGPYTWSY